MPCNAFRVRRPTAAGPAALLVALLLTAGPRAGAGRVAAAEAGPVHRAVSGSVCTVTAENAWGMPVAVANGFLLGDGRFVVSDLGSVARPGVRKVTLRFEGGRSAEVTQFGLADVSLGLVALRVEGPVGRRGGLPLATALPPLDGLSAVAIAGREWGGAFNVATGRLWRGPSAMDVAARAHIDSPGGVGYFLRMAGGRLEAASGAPVVNDRGTVLAVHLAVAASGIHVPLAMPACSLRQSLLSAEPELRPLSDLPRPAWPVEVLRLAGRPPKPAGFRSARQRIRETASCSRCGGKGKVRLEVEGGHREWVPCPRCHGEGIAMESGLYQLLATWAEEGTRAVWAPGEAGRIPTAARGAGQEMLQWLAGAGRHFRSALAREAGREVSRGGRPAPRGLVIYGEVRQVVAGPDGRYVILDPVETDAVVAVRRQDLLGHDGRGPSGPGRAAPGRRAWIVLAGAVVGSLDATRYRGVCVLPFEWRGCPTPGPVRRVKR